MTGGLGSPQVRYDAAFLTRERGECPVWSRKKGRLSMSSLKKDSTGHLRPSKRGKKRKSPSLMSQGGKDSPIGQKNRGGEMLLVKRKKKGGGGGGEAILKQDQFYFLFFEKRGKTLRRSPSERGEGRFADLLRGSLKPVGGHIVNRSLRGKTFLFPSERGKKYAFKSVIKEKGGGRDQLMGWIEGRKNLCLLRDEKRIR